MRALSSYNTPSQAVTYPVVANTLLEIRSADTGEAMVTQPQQTFIVRTRASNLSMTPQGPLSARLTLSPKAIAAGLSIIGPAEQM